LQAARGPSHGRFCLRRVAGVEISHCYMFAMTDEQRPIPSSAHLVRYLHADRPVRLKNSTCPYCRCVLTSHHNRNLEHVIGRRFVPKGTMAGSWNLHLWACKSCNDEKAGLESDISAVTLHQLAFMPIDHGDAARHLWPEVKRKGRVHSPVSGRFVAESRTNTSIAGHMGPMQVKFDLVGPPQMDPDRVLRLAAMHVRGLAYLPLIRRRTALRAFLGQSCSLRSAGAAIGESHPGRPRIVHNAYRIDLPLDRDRSFMT
jgi:hypothetical protein